MLETAIRLVGWLVGRITNDLNCTYEQSNDLMLTAV